MPHSALGLHRATSRTSGGPTARVISLTTLILLVALILQPIQMRAGAADPHPHALMQILLDVRDGAIDHHAADDQRGRRLAASHDVPRVFIFDPDLPRLENAKPVSSGTMALAPILAVFWSFLGRLERIWQPQAPWQDRLPDLEPPPPRVGRF